MLPLLFNLITLLFGLDLIIALGNESSEGAAGLGETGGLNKHHNRAMLVYSRDVNMFGVLSGLGFSL